MDMNGYVHGATITKSDSANLPNVAQALYVGGAGDVAVVTAGGEQLTFVAVPAGTTIPIRVTKVLSSGTSASNIVGLWN